MGFREDNEMDCGGKEFIRRGVDAMGRLQHSCQQTESGSLKDGGSQPEVRLSLILQQITGKGERTGVRDHSSHKLEIWALGSLLARD